jgi:hypothetical protein
MNKNNLIIKCCENCIKGVPVGIGSEILCRDKGIVSSDYCCSGFIAFEPITLQRQLDYRCSDCTYFTFTPESQNSSYGVCSLFSVRKCDGSLKKACSYFVKKSGKTA